MSKLWLYSGLALVGVGLARHLASGPPTPRLRRGDRLLVVGDSLAVGLAPYLSALARDAGVHVTALAKQSTRIDQWAQSPALAQALAAHPTVVLVSLGTNDAYMDHAAKAQAPHLERLLAAIAGARAQVAWVGPPTLPTLARAPSRELLDLLVARVPAGAYFPSHTYPIERGPDRLHPSARGYAAWAAAIWCWLTAERCSTPGA